MHAMSHESGANAIKDFLDYFESHPASPDMQRKLLSALGLPADLANSTSKQFYAELKAQTESFASHPPPAMATLGRLNEAFGGMKDRLREMNDDFVRAFGDPGAKAISTVADLMHQEVGDVEAIARGVGTVYGWLEKLNALGPQGNVIGRISGAMLPSPGTIQNWDQKYTWLGKLDKSLGFDAPGAASGTSSDVENTAARSTKKGTFEALRDYFGPLFGNAGGDFSGAGGGGAAAVFGEAARARLSGQSGSGYPS